jgi:hypothetical protein
MALALALCPTGLSAQGPGDAGPSFLIFRYASRSALSMYSGYATGPVLLVAGMLVNPRTEYREIMAGVGKPFVGLHGNGITLVPAVAWSSTGWYAQLYVLPSLSVGALSLSATVQLGEPLSTGGTRAAFVSPATLLFDLGGVIAVGAAYYGSAEWGGNLTHGAGPAVRLAIPHGSITLELVKGFSASLDEVRVNFRSNF